MYSVVASQSPTSESIPSLMGLLRGVNDGVQLLGDFGIDALGVQELRQAVIVGLADQGRRVRFLVETREEPVEEVVLSLDVGTPWRGSTQRIERTLDLVDALLHV